MSRRPPPPHRYVYVIGPQVGLQKVGIATDPKQRLATLQTACPFDLFLHLAVAVPFNEAHGIERRAHRALARSCVRNEWFEATPADAIAAVRSAAAARPAAKPVAEPTPAEWRISRAKLISVTPPAPPPGFRSPPRGGAPLAPTEPNLGPLFDYAKRAGEADEKLIDRVVGALLKRMGG